jgi:tetratricopeptide (TPR) repeat protein
MRLLVAAFLLLAPAAAAAQPAARPATVGEVAFANSGAPAAQAPFLRGLALLHNFEYPAAAAAFREAQAADPGFAMAYWGEAMTHNHPVWMEQDAEAARAVLARLGPTREARLAKAESYRERVWLDAVETLYGEGGKEDRDRAYSDKMATLHGAFPDDVDARAFYALSLLGLAHEGRDVALYMRAAALLEEAFPDNRRHPGVLHYLIHSYDDATHAPLGLRAARLYGAVAPEAGHALHMTSHIFLARGMWEAAERANVAAIETVNRQRAAAGQRPVRCGHYAEWLVYARLQQGKDADAAADIAACREAAGRELASDSAGGPIESSRSGVRSWADMAVRQRIETGRSGAEPPALPDGRYLATRFTLAYGDLLAAGRDLAKVRGARLRLEQAHGSLAAARGGDEAGPAEARREAIVLRQAAGLEKLARGDAAGGLAELEAAAEMEAAMPAEFGPPLVEKPSRELLGDALLALGRRDEARRAYEAALAATPGRRLALRGLDGR